MPSHRADAPTPLRRPRENRSGSRRTRGGSGSERKSPRPRSSLSAPQVGIAGALGIATIAAPLSGAMGNMSPKAEINHLSAVRSVVGAPFPQLPGVVGRGVTTFQVVTGINPSAEAPALLAAPKNMIVGRASRSGERSVLPGCDGVKRSTGAPNGQLASSVLCTLWNPHFRLRADAAVALAKLNVAYKQHFGDDICLTTAYRTLAEQRRLRSIEPSLAAVPGTSEHGWGLAVDLCDGVENGSGSRFQWLRANASAYGWDNPDWAHVGGGGPYEPWHWEYVAGE